MNPRLTRDLISPPIHRMFLPYGKGPYFKCILRPITRKRFKANGNSLLATRAEMKMEKGVTYQEKNVLHSDRRIIS